MAFMFSCTQNSVGGDSNAVGNSSSSGNGGGQVLYLYCVNSVTEVCTPGSFTECPLGEAPKDECPAGFSKGGVSSSSSSSAEIRIIKGSFTDTRDNKTYNTVKIGEQIWMAENLNYYEDDSRCYEDLESYCNKYGRLYNWITAMDLPTSCQSTSCDLQRNVKHRGICPSDWHIPTRNEWDELRNSVGSSVDAKHLKAKEGWEACISDSNKISSCEDTYGFTALPGGMGYSDGGFSGVGRSGIWWGNESSAQRTYCISMSAGGIVSSVSQECLKSLRYSIRCIKD
jgi:uncharacterized protein (TIGR02145 family)